MRLLLDECVPKRLKRELSGHEVRTVQEAGWAGVKNGALLRGADGLFDVLLTVDQGVQYQQSLSGLRISIVVMVAPSSDIDDLRPLLPLVVEALGLPVPDRRRNFQKFYVETKDQVDHGQARRAEGWRGPHREVAAIG